MTTPALPNSWTTELPPPPSATSAPRSPQTGPPAAPEATNPQETSPTPPPVVTTTPESRLDQLTAQWWEAKQTADAAAKRAKELSESVKTESLRQAPEGTEALILRSPHLPTPYKVHRRMDWRLDSKGLKAADPLTYARWAKQTFSWRMDPVD